PGPGPGWSSRARHEAPFEDWAGSGERFPPIAKLPCDILDQDRVCLTAETGDIGRLRGENLPRKTDAVPIDREHAGTRRAPRLGEAAASLQRWIVKQDGSTPRAQREARGTCCH